jgi:hypothetical protein
MLRSFDASTLRSFDASILRRFDPSTFNARASPRSDVPIACRRVRRVELNAIVEFELEFPMLARRRPQRLAARGFNARRLTSNVGCSTPDVQRLALANARRSSHIQTSDV